MIPCTNPNTATFMTQAAALLERQLVLETSCNAEAYVVALDDAPVFLGLQGKLSKVDGVSVPMMFLSLEDAQLVAAHNVPFDFVVNDTFDELNRLRRGADGLAYELEG